MKSYKNKQKNIYLKKRINASLNDDKGLVKKNYTIIVGLQDEITKQTIKNYNLLEENGNLKQKINNINSKLIKIFLIIFIINLFIN